MSHTVVVPDSLPAEIIAAATSWADRDPDDETAAAVRALVDAEDPSLAELFGGRIAFGTAGLRAAMGPGPNRMNRLVVRQTTVGLMRWLPTGARVVIGYDARHNSATFADDIAAMVLACGGVAELLPRPLPTPVLAHAVLHRGADAGVMVTASHNPSADNGYKLYLADGIQLVSPADVEIAAAIDEVAATWQEAPSVPADRSVTVLGEDVIQAHLDAAVSTLHPGSGRAVKVVYTAMHGVGGEHFLAAMERAEFPSPVVVAEQFAPDPDFPTAAFPNPEEPGALDLALAAAAADTTVAAVLAHDPDADRLAIAVPARGAGPSRGAEAPRRFVRLSGDQVGILLAEHLLRRPADGRRRMVAKSLVSSRLLERLADHHEAECFTTLTGFKWVARPIVEHPDDQYVLGYEEALGYCVGDKVRDKDGISAGLVAAEFLAEVAAAGETVWDRLDGLATRHGVHLTGPVTIRLAGADGVALRSAILERLIARPPTELAGSVLRSVENLAEGGRFQPTPGLVLEYADHSRVIVRPSGTEPKLKAYIEVIEPVEGSTIDAANERAESRLVDYQRELTEILDRPLNDRRSASGRDSPSSGVR